MSVWFLFGPKTYVCTPMLSCHSKSECVRWQTLIVTLSCEPLPVRVCVIRYWSRDFACWSLNFMPSASTLCNLRVCTCTCACVSSVHCTICIPDYGKRVDLSQYFLQKYLSSFWKHFMPFNESHSHTHTLNLYTVQKALLQKFQIHKNEKWKEK